MSKELTIVNIKASELKEADYNPRLMTDDQHTQLKKSIEKFGLVDPLLVNEHADRKNIIVGGHQRFKIAKELGIEMIPCVMVNLNLEDEKELNLRLNKNLGEWDFDKLANQFNMEDLHEVGFIESDLGLIFNIEEPKEKELEAFPVKSTCPKCGYDLT